MGHQMQIEPFAVDVSCAPPVRLALLFCWKAAKHGMPCPSSCASASASSAPAAQHRHPELMELQAQCLSATESHITAQRLQQDKEGRRCDSISLLVRR